MLNTVWVLVGMVAMLTLASRLLSQTWPRDTGSEPLRCAAFLVLSFAAIYVEVLISGAFGLFTAPVLGMVNVGLMVWLFARDRDAFSTMARTLSRTASLPFEDSRPLMDRLFVAWLLMLVIVEGAVPKSVGDDVDYHLQNIMQIAESGATLRIVPGYGVDLTVPVSYYVRGYEAILAYFFHGAGAAIWVVVLALSALAIVYFGLLEFSGQPRLARAQTFFLATGLMYGAPYKGDLLLAALSLFVMAISIRHQRDVRVVAVPVLSALALMLALKSSTLMLATVALVVLTWRLRVVWSPARIVGALLVTGLLGFAFYLGNLFYLGNPVFPFPLTVGNTVVFDGPTTLNVFGTTLLGNLDRDLVLPLVRGFVRQTSPLALLLAPLLLWLSWRGLRKESGSLSSLLLVVCLLTFVTTPYSDNSGGVPHFQLYSGQTLRMALPLLLLTMALAASALSGSERASTLAARSFACLAVANVVWYDLASLLLKPSNAFAAYAPLFHSFNVQILAAGFVSLSCVALLVAARARPQLALLGALVLAATLSAVHGVSSFAYSPAFRRLGESSLIVKRLTDLGDRSKVVGVLLSDEGATGPLRGVITPVLYQSFKRFEVVRSPAQAVGYDVVVVPSAVDETIGDIVHGRTYQLQKPVHTLQALARAGYVSLFDDTLYAVLGYSGATKSSSSILGANTSQ